MRRILMLSLLAAAGVACGPSRSEVDVVWTFGGLSCTDAGVSRIEFAIAGEVLTPDHYSCAEAGYGASLGVYQLGRYELTVSGFDTGGTLTHQVTQTIDVRGGRLNTFTIDVPQVASTTGDVTLHWTFAGKTCSQAGITVVHASVDGQVLTDANNNPDLPCSQGGVDGTTVSPLAAGQHTFDLVGLDGSGQARYALNSYLVTVVSGQNALYNPDLAAAAPTTASASLSWTFSSNGGAAMSCAAANVDHVQIFVDPAPNGTGGVSAGTVACNTAGTDGASVEGLTAGTHSFAILGIRNGTLVYRTHNPPSSYFAVGLITNVTVSAESPL